MCIYPSRIVAHIREYTCHYQCDLLFRFAGVIEHSEGLQSSWRVGAARQHATDKMWVAAPATKIAAALAAAAATPCLAYLHSEPPNLEPCVLLSGGLILT